MMRSGVKGIAGGIVQQTHMLLQLQQIVVSLPKAPNAQKIEKKSKKSENVEAGWESAFRCLCVLEPQQSAINRHIRAQWTFLRGIDDTCEMWMRSGAEIGRPDLRLRSSGTDCEWHL